MIDATKAFAIAVSRYRSHAERGVLLFDATARRAGRDERWRVGAAVFIVAGFVRRGARFSGALLPRAGELRGVTQAVREPLGSSRRYSH
jgi:hypothetical protein